MFSRPLAELDQVVGKEFGEPSRLSLLGDCRSTMVVLSYVLRPIIVGHCAQCQLVIGPVWLCELCWQEVASESVHVQSVPRTAMPHTVRRGRVGHCTVESGTGTLAGLVGSWTDQHPKHVGIRNLTHGNSAYHDNTLRGGVDAVVTLLAEVGKIGEG